MARVHRPPGEATAVINARALQEADAGTPLEVVPPVLFNTFKHHAGALRARLGGIVAAGPAGLEAFAGCLAVLGTRLMDFYTGALSPRDISTRVRDHLGREGVLELGAFRAWLAARDDYAVVPFAEDSSRWVLRLGDEAGRYVHLHPGRWSPATLRVRANVIKTAVVAVAHAGLFGGDPMDRALLNEVRQRHLGLSPLGQAPEEDAGLGAVIAVLRPSG
jgi:hypothetical protein